jgi:transposase, IS30 family
MEYKHLTLNERYHIYDQKNAGFSLAAIGREMGRHPTTINRELKRNTGARNYRPNQAHEFSLARRSACSNAPRISTETWQTVEDHLALSWSPEQICGHLKVNDLPSVSHERIYQYIYADKKAGGKLHLTLRAQKRYRKRTGGRDRRGSIPNQISIDLRPDIVAARGRFGDWEGDLVMGANHQHALVTLNERVSRYSLIGFVPSKCADVVANKIITMVKPFLSSIKTLTTDNGKEFAQHERITKALGAQHYFAHPYCSWERGANENMNGLIREFFPKGTSFANITIEQIQAAMDKLNHRPRKCLNWKTPHEVFFSQLNSKLRTVALRT